MLELTLRDGMVIVGSLLILAVAVDAWRRMRQQQRSRVRVRLATDVPGDDPIDDIGQYRELPNGGARVVRRDDSVDRSLASLGLGDAENAPSAAAAGVAGGNAAVDFPESSAPGGKQPPPVPATGGASEEAVSSPGPGTAADLDAEPDIDTNPKIDTAAPGPAAGTSESSSEEPATPDASAQFSDAPEQAEDDFDEAEVLAGVSAREPEPTNLDWLVDLPDNDHPDEPAPGALPRQSDTEVIILHVTAREEAGFAGQDILEILLACDLRFGDMDFFHRHEEQAGRGAIQFSVANMLQPGVFDIDHMDEMRTRGLVFFLTLPGPEDMILAFDCMLETARTVARNLHGELLDESRSVLTQQAVEHSRQQIRELDRRLRSRDG